MARPGAVELFILAGEPSGDRLGADLVRRLRSRLDVSLSGVGGPALEAEGLRPLFAMGDIAVMGLTDVILRLPLLLWRIEQTARAAIARRPDIVVLIDAQEFSARVAGRMRTLGATMPILLYVAPSVWGRAPHRAARLKPLFDEVLAILPFEPAVMARLGGPPTRYVGHPALAEALTAVEGRDTGLVALLPGSRPGELRRHLPLFRNLAQRLAERQEVTGLVLPTLADLQPQLAAATSRWGVPVIVTADRDERKAMYGQCLAAVCSAGTATLELATAGVPMVVTYVMDPIQSRGYVRLGRPRTSLPNIVLGEDVVPEVILDSPDPAALTWAVDSLLTDRESRTRQQSAFARLRVMMQRGLEGQERQDPAERVLAHLRR